MSQETFLGSGRQANINAIYFGSHCIIIQPFGSVLEICVVLLWITQSVFDVFEPEMFEYPRLAFILELK